MLAPLGQLAAERGVAVVLVAHTRKSAADFADDTILGSRAFSGIARSVLHLMSDREDRTRKLLLAGKNNLSVSAPGLVFTITGDPARREWEPDPKRRKPGCRGQRCVPRQTLNIKPKKEKVKDGGWIWELPEGAQRAVAARRCSSTEEPEHLHDSPGEINENSPTDAEFVAPDQKRKTIRLGKTDRRTADGVARHVETLLAALIGGQPAGSRSHRPRTRIRGRAGSRCPYRSRSRGSLKRRGNLPKGARPLSICRSTAGKRGTGWGATSARSWCG